MESVAISPHEKITIEEPPNIKPVDYEINFSTLNDNLGTLEYPQNVTIKNCQSMKSAVSVIQELVQEFYLKHSTSVSATFEIEEESVEVTEVQFHDIVQYLKPLERFFILSFESTRDGSCFIYWRLPKRLEIFSTQIVQNSAEIGSFVRKFLIDSLEGYHNGKCE